MTSIKINVGGTIFHTTQQTLSMSAYFSAFISRWLDNPEDIPFIDRNPRLFEHVLSFMRDPNYPYPEEYKSELDYFGIIFKEPKYRYRYVSLGAGVLVYSGRVEHTFLRLLSQLESGDNIVVDKKTGKTAVVTRIKKEEFYESNLVRYKGTILSAERTYDEESGDEEVETPLTEVQPRMRTMVRLILQGANSIPIYSSEGEKIMNLNVETEDE